MTLFANLQQRIPVTIYDTPQALGQSLAHELLAQINAAAVTGRPYLLGCPGGRSLRSTYQALGEQARHSQANLAHLVIVMMDEYVLPVGRRFSYCPEAVHYSCRRFARQEIQAVINAGLPAERQIPDSQLWFPDPAQPVAYDARLQAAGGIDHFLVASGASDGHVAFNPPGSRLTEPSHIIPLAETTRRDNLKTFPDFSSLDEVPGYGVSVGLGTIAGLSRQVTLVIHGQQKQFAVRRLAECAGFNPDWPASMIFECAQPRLLLDKAAATTLFSEAA
jgi:glucosamine-6-phosphate deaminase